MYLPKSNVGITTQHLKNIAALSAEQKERLLRGISDHVVHRDTASATSPRTSPARAQQAAQATLSNFENSGATARPKVKKKQWQRQPQLKVSTAITDVVNLAYEKDPSYYA